MQFAVGDKVVHPLHGPGRITGVEYRELLDGKKRYYVLEIPDKDLTVYIPRQKVESVGVRPAMKRAKLNSVLDTLRSKPHRLPQDYKERHEEVWEKLRTARVLQTAEVVRDLSWHKHWDHLTKKDASLLERAQAFLAAELALVSDTGIPNATEVIETTLASAMAREVEVAQAH
jgi:CarD family transcriptional regulator